VSSSGLIVVDKPIGPTSHDVVGRVRRLTGVRRVGHAGTLDPLASGVLLVCVGPATRLVEYLVGLDKVYETTIRLGQATTTYDAEGEIAAERPVALTVAEIAAALDGFRGTIRQRVPPYSAVKQDGQPLYKRARRGEAIDLPQREVAIHALDLLSYEPPLLALRVVSSSGVYIRSLAHDLGEALGCGGHVAALRRTAVGRFTLDEAAALDELTPDNIAARLLPPEAAVAHLPRIDFDGDAAARLVLGRRPAAPAGNPVGDAAAFGPDGRFLGIVTAEEGQWRPRKMLNVVTEE
jgi:tRNA pseudouridine55 synthase